MSLIEFANQQIEIKLYYKRVKTDSGQSQFVVLNDKENEEHYPYDTFIVSMGRKSNDDLYKKLKESIEEIYSIGDADKIGEIMDAMTAADTVARKI